MLRFQGFLALAQGGDRAGPAAHRGRIWTRWRPRLGTPTNALAGLVAHPTRDASRAQVRELDFMPLGGAYNRLPAAATGYVHRGDRFLLKQGVSVDPGASAGEPAAARRWLARSAALPHPWGSGRAYQNFPEPGLPAFAKAHHGTNLDRLLRVKQAYDPYGFFGS